MKPNAGQENWRPVRLGDICRLRGGTAVSQRLQGDRPPGLRFLKVGDLALTPGSAPIDDARHWVEEEVFGAKATPPGASVFAKIGEGLRANRVRRLGVGALIDNNMMAAIPDEGSVEAEFLTMLLSGMDLAQFAVGSALPYLRAGDLAKVTLYIPPLAVQREVIRVVGSLNDRIDNNRRTASIAEELAATLFRSWFVDFDPVHAKVAGLAPVGVHDEAIELTPDSFEESEIGPIPAGWTVRALSELGRFVNGGALTKGATGLGRAIVRIAEMKGGVGGATKYTDADVPDDQTVRPGDLLFAWSGSLCAMRWSLPEAVINQHIFKCIPNEGVPEWVLEGFVQRAMHEFIAIAADKATTMGHIRRGDLDSPKGALPPPELMGALDEIAGPLLALRMSMLTEAHALEAVRDALLPKLVSGQVRVEPDEAQAA